MLDPEDTQDLDNQEMRLSRPYSMETAGKGKGEWLENGLGGRPPMGRQLASCGEGGTQANGGLRATFLFILSKSQIGRDGAEWQPTLPQQRKPRVRCAEVRGAIFCVC